jgi:hypothetical protein
VAGGSNGAGVGAALAGLASVATLPVAVYLTRFSERYELLHAGFAIPLAAGLGILAVALSRRAGRRSALRLAQGGRGGAVTAGRMLGIAGICLAAAAVVSLVVYGLLEYVGSRD